MRRKVLLFLKGKLYAKVIRKNGKVENKGKIAEKLITSAGVAFLVDAFQGLPGFAINNFNFHDTGTGSTPESIENTTLQSPTGQTRVSGIQGEGTTPNIYKTVATIVYDAPFALTEHGIFSSITGGTLWDRSVFPVVNVIAGDSIEWRYELECLSGG